MNNNINRLIRLLQQILEFRKSETGNLKLRVSEGDLTQFVHRSLDSFRPLMKKKDIQFQISCSPDPFNAYFVRTNLIRYSIIYCLMLLNIIVPVVWSVWNCLKMKTEQHD